MVGLDGAGKTTILYCMKLGVVRETTPTVGFNVETVSFGEAEMPVWDLGGSEKSRPLWKHYFTNTKVIFFVVDSSDQERLEDAKIELDLLLEEPMLSNAVILIFANKQDKEGALHVSELVNKWHLNDHRSRSWYVMGCSATTRNDELIEGVQWVADVISNNARTVAKAKEKKLRDFGTPEESDCVLIYLSLSRPVLSLPLFSLSHQTLLFRSTLSHP
eukprot:TRINITY_DN13550_c0_g1_i1.p1 TRINITY_DN13550_c0_g1~~TRINITY_DN13550_c0_g1_i1.p1  ORF type:complete len:247 (+),score=51.27 TRINITY_DN13550_c0_g1_i1:92-742(+)